MRVTTISDEGLSLIKRFEGLELEAYQDVAGVWTIGYGHTGDDARLGARITEARAEDLLREDVARFERALANALPPDTTQEQFDALVSLAYNIGAAAFLGSTAFRRHLAGDWPGAAEAMAWWNKATINGRKVPVRGLTRRRAAEAALYLSGAPEGVVAACGVKPGTSEAEPLA